jgi:hypothetical protein
MIADLEYGSCPETVSNAEYGGVTPETLTDPGLIAVIDKWLGFWIGLLITGIIFILSR